MRDLANILYIKTIDLVEIFYFILLFSINNNYESRHASRNHNFSQDLVDEDGPSSLLLSPFLGHLRLLLVYQLEMKLDSCVGVLLFISFVYIYTYIESINLYLVEILKVSIIINIKKKFAT